MVTGRMPACDIDTLAGRDITSALTNNIQSDNIKSECATQAHIFLKGNKCGHDKNSFKKPQYPTKHKRRPHCLEEAKRRLDLAIMDPFRYSDITGLFFHRNEDRTEAENTRRTNRRRRSEGVEGIFSLALPTLLHTLNLYKMACGYYDSGQNFHFYDYFQLQKISGQTLSRFKREMKFLQDNDIVKVFAIRELTNDGAWRTKETRIEFTDKIFSILQLMPEFLKDRETSAIKFHEKQARLDKNRKKRDFYRKTTFTSSKAPINRNLNANSTPQLQNAIKGLVKEIPQSKAGNGVEVRDKINALVRQGFSVSDAMAIVRQQSPPH
jgi:hypothetical protein